MKPKENNFAFIDSNNLNLGIQKLGWKLAYRKFRTYLAEKYGVIRAYMFIGFVPLNQALYSKLQGAGFVIQLKPTVSDEDGNVKGNVDADLVLQAALDMQNYDKAVIVSSDGDFYSLVKHLYENNKLLFVLSPYVKTCSKLLRKEAKEKIYSMDNLRQKLGQGMLRK